MSSTILRSEGKISSRNGRERGFFFNFYETKCISKSRRRTVLKQILHWAVTRALWRRYNIIIIQYRGLRLQRRHFNRVGGGTTAVSDELRTVFSLLSSVLILAASTRAGPRFDATKKKKPLETITDHPGSTVSGGEAFNGVRSLRRTVYS